MKKVQNIINFLLAVVVTIIAVILLDIESWWLIGGIFLVSYPWKVQRSIHHSSSVYSFFGGVNMDGDVYSAFPLFQIAEGDAFAFFGITFFQVAKEDVDCFLGVVFMQISDEAVASIDVGFVFLQLGRKGAKSSAAIHCFQISSEKSQCVLGLTLVQYGGIKATSGVSLCGVQSGGSVSNDFGLTIYQTARRIAVCRTGIIFIQKAGDKAYLGFGIAFYQAAEEYGIHFGKAKELLNIVFPYCERE